MLHRSFRMLACGVVAVLAAFSQPVTAQVFTADGTLDPGQFFLSSARQILVSDQYIIVRDSGSFSPRVKIYDRTSFALLRNKEFDFTLSASPNLALQGDRLFIGDPQAGRVRVYSIAQDQIIQNVNYSVADFGVAVASNSSRILVAAPGAGQAILHFSNSGGVVATIPAPDWYGVVGDSTVFFGSPIALTEEYGVIGQNSPDGGLAMVIDPLTGQVLRTLHPPLGSAETPEFGRRVAAWGRTAAITDTRYRINDDGLPTGAVHVFDLSTGDLQYTLRPQPFTSTTTWGRTVTMNEDVILVGSPRETVDNILRSGAAYAFRRADGAYLGRLEQSIYQADGEFGAAVAVHNSVLFSGSRFGVVNWFSTVAAEITSQPISQVAQANTQTTFSVAVTPPLTNDVTYQWRLNGKPVGDGPDFQGAQSPTLTVLASDDTEGFYDCVISRLGFPSVTSNPAVLAVLPDPNACYADANNDGQLNFFDIARYIQLFNAGCP